MYFNHTSAPDLAARWKLRRAGQDWRGDCPACGYSDSFVLSENAGWPLGWCASCQNNDAIAAWLRCHGAAVAPPERAPGLDRDRQRQNVARALRIWGQGIACPGTPAAAYLAARGIACVAASSALRFLPLCPHPSGARLPALLGLFQDAAGTPTGIHRTFIKPDGTGKAAADPVKATLGRPWGAAIRLAPVASDMVIAEGIETAWSAGELLGLPAWAAFSAGNLASGLVLPDAVRSVVIAADNDPPDRYGRQAGQEAAKAAMARWQSEGLVVRIAMPNRVGDFNDILRGRLAGEAKNG